MAYKVTPVKPVFAGERVFFPELKIYQDKSKVEGGTPQDFGKLYLKEVGQTAFAKDFMDSIEGTVISEQLCLRISNDMKLKYIPISTQEFYCKNDLLVDMFARQGCRLQGTKISANGQQYNEYNFKRSAAISLLTKSGDTIVLMLAGKNMEAYQEQVQGNRDKLVAEAKIGMSDFAYSIENIKITSELQRNSKGATYYTFKFETSLNPEEVANELDTKLRDAEKLELPEVTANALGLGGLGDGMIVDPPKPRETEVRTIDKPRGEEADTINIDDLPF